MESTEELNLEDEKGRCDPHLRFPEPFSKGQILTITMGIIKHESMGLVELRHIFTELSEVRTENTGL